MASMSTLPPMSGYLAERPALARPTTFEQLAALPEERIDVVMGAALIARDAYAGLDLERLDARFDELAAPLIARGAASSSPAEQVQMVSSYLYEELGFRGNEQDYYDPKNSLLPDVLDRRLGIPITLALVYCEVARRAGIRARGVSFPGHFLVRVDPAGREDAPLAVDPFFGGQGARRGGAPEAARAIVARAEAGSRGAPRAGEPQDDARPHAHQLEVDLRDARRLRARIARARSHHLSDARTRFLRCASAACSPCASARSRRRGPICRVSSSSCPRPPMRARFASSSRSCTRRSRC